MGRAVKFMANVIVSFQEAPYKSNERSIPPDTAGASWADGPVASAFLYSAISSS